MASKAVVKSSRLYPTPTSAFSTSLISPRPKKSPLILMSLMAFYSTFKLNSICPAGVRLDCLNSNFGFFP